MKNALRRGWARVGVALVFGTALMVSTPAADFAGAAEKNSPKVEIYTTTWCTACKQAVAYLRTKRIPFTEYDVEKDPAAARRWKEIGSNGGVPVAVIGNRVVRGFSRESFDKALSEAR